MLSYRHSFHAGNHADVLKHIIFMDILQYYLKKEAGFVVIDTHSGAGLYDLTSNHAAQLQEHVLGVEKLMSVNWPEIADYKSIIEHFNSNLKDNPSSLKTYPGSSMITAKLLRSQDTAWCFELHPTDFKILQDNYGGIQPNCRLKTKCADGLEGLISLVPPPSRRGVVLIDPSYEIKSDYRLVVETLNKAYQRFATGTYALWYPVIDRRTIDTMERQLKKTGIKNIQQFELGVKRGDRSSGMNASGLFVINPPWTLKQSMEQLLPKLSKLLRQDDQYFSKVKILVEE